MKNIFILILFFWPSHCMYTSHRRSNESVNPFIKKIIIHIKYADGDKLKLKFPRNKSHEVQHLVKCLTQSNFIGSSIIEEYKMIINWRNINYIKVENLDVLSYE